jgi:hypothetical protein
MQNKHFRKSYTYRKKERKKKERTLDKLGIYENFLDLKGTQENFTDNVILTDKDKNFTSNTKNKTLLFNIMLKVPASAIRQEKEI